jgi:hypothetical protein
MDVGTGMSIGMMAQSMQMDQLANSVIQKTQQKVAEQQAVQAGAPPPEMAGPKAGNATGGHIDVYV